MPWTCEEKPLPLKNSVIVFSSSLWLARFCSCIQQKPFFSWSVKPSVIEVFLCQADTHVSLSRLCPFDKSACICF